MFYAVVLCCFEKNHEYRLVPVIVDGLTGYVVFNNSGVWMCFGRCTILFVGLRYVTMGLPSKSWPIVTATFFSWLLGFLGCFRCSELTHERDCEFIIETGKLKIFLKFLIVRNLFLKLTRIGTRQCVMCFQMLLPKAWIFEGRIAHFTYIRMSFGNRYDSDVRFLNELTLYIIVFQLVCSLIDTLPLQADGPEHLCRFLCRFQHCQQLQQYHHLQNIRNFPVEISKDKLSGL